ncbi:MAG: hypothetical protein FWC50_12245 [Planctomycetaceae bacterium]|nr:hypothetical protein [Planctomycetaceae bacterium]
MKRLLILLPLTIVAMILFSMLHVMGQSNGFRRMDEKPKQLKGTLQPLATRNPPVEPQQLPPFVGVVNTQPVPLQSRSIVPASSAPASSTPMSGTGANSGTNIRLVSDQIDPNAPNPTQNAVFQTPEQTIVSGEFEMPKDVLTDKNQNAAAPPSILLSVPSSVSSSVPLPVQNAVTLQQPQLGEEQPGGESEQSTAGINPAASSNDNQVRFTQQPIPQYQPVTVPSPPILNAGPPVNNNPSLNNDVLPKTTSGFRQKTDMERSLPSTLLSQTPPSQVSLSQDEVPPIPMPVPAQPAQKLLARTNPDIDVRYDGNTIKTHEMPKLSSQPSDLSPQDEGTGLPGPKEIAGVQTPQLVIEKIMPPEVQINEPVSIKIVVRNTGSSKAKNVLLTDRVPRGAKLFETGTNTTRKDAGGNMVWELGDIGINEEKTAEMLIIPLTEGEIGSVATATFTVEATASTRVTKPALTLEVKTIDKELLVGSDVVLEIILSNPGTGTAKNIILEENVPDGLSHPKGKELRSPIGDLAPKESKHLKLTLKCERPGETTNYLVAKADNGLLVESKMPVAVLSPGLKLAIDGPKVRYLERKATYTLSVANPGSATTRDVTLAAKLPKGLDFVSTDSNGVYDPNTHTVHWALDELPSQQSGNIELVMLPREIGELSIEFSGKATNGLTSSTSHEVSVDGIAALGFEIANKVDPVELGHDAIYEIRVYNSGSKTSGNIVMSVQLPEGMRYVSADGPTPNRVSGGSITFDRLSQLAPKEEKTYQVKARCLVTGDQRIKVQMQSDELQVPVTKEESTKVYGDE